MIDTPAGGLAPTARLSTAIEVNESTTLRASGYRGWRMQRSTNCSVPFRAGADATAANPERSLRHVGYRSGVDFRKAGFHLSATIFANRLKDAIGNVSLGRGPGSFRAWLCRR